MILSFGGSLGADTVNKAVAELMARHAGGQNYYHFHGTGRGAYDGFIRYNIARGGSFYQPADKGDRIHKRHGPLHGGGRSCHKPRGGDYAQ